MVALSLFATGSNISFTLNPTESIGSIVATGPGLVQTLSEGFTSGPSHSGHVTLLYTYTPAGQGQTPEPSSMFLLGGGLAAMASFARRLR